MAQDLINLGISPELIKPIVDTHIKALIVEALGGTQELVNNAVEGFLAAKVDKDNGKVSTSRNDYNTTSLFNYYFNKLLADSVQSAIKEALTENKDQIRDAVKRSLMRSKGDRFADAVIDCVTGCFEKSWRADVKVEISKNNDD